MLQFLSTRLIVMSLLTLIAGCSTLPDKQRWGEDVSFGGWQRIKTAAWNAARDPETWVPVAAALVLSIGDLDEDLSDWAVRETPVFGSESSAQDASDDLRDVLAAATVISALATPSGPEPGAWLTSKFKGMLVEGAAVGINDSVTNALKDVTDRERPDKRSDNSFPSLHSSEAYSYATLTARNIDSLNLSPGTRMVLRISAKTLAAGTAWARVEGRRHYPTDVLAGAALGYFISAVIHDSFMGLDESVYVAVELDGSDGGMLTLHWPW
jgi:hypothetical protein